MKTRLFTVVSSLLIIIISFTSCNLPWIDDDPGIEYFMSIEPDVSIQLDSSAIIGYESEKSRFNVDEDVVLTFHFGFWFDGDIEKAREEMDIPWFEIWFKEFPQYKDDETIECFVERRDEQFVTEKYGYTMELNEDGTKKCWIYNHSEDIIIPKEMFYRDYGIMHIVLYGPDLKAENTEPMSFGGGAIEYTKSGNMIELIQR